MLCRGFKPWITPTFLINFPVIFLPFTSADPFVFPLKYLAVGVKFAAAPCNNLLRDGLNLLVLRRPSGFFSHTSKTEHFFIFIFFHRFLQAKCAFQNDLKTILKRNRPQIGLTFLDSCEKHEWIWWHLMNAKRTGFFHSKSAARLPSASRRRVRRTSCFYWQNCHLQTRFLLESIALREKIGWGQDKISCSPLCKNALGM